MRRYLLAIFIAIGCLYAQTQIFDELNTYLYKGRVKLVSEFMNRFNGDEINPFIDANSPDISKLNLCQLFDADFVIKNREEIEPKVLQFVDSVLINKTHIKYSDPNWFAKVTCMGSFKGKEITFDIFLVVEPRGHDMYKWVIADVAGDLFDLKPSMMSESIMLLPNENESNFMSLYSITADKDDYITLYSSKANKVNRLSVFNTLVYYGYLNIEYVSDIEYTFLQVPGYSFSIKEFERDSTNSGWLISSWQQISNGEKIELLNRLYNGKYAPKPAEVIPQQDTIIDKSEREDTACKLVNQFICDLNEFVTTKSLIARDSIEKAVTGRYTFIISDELSNQLANFFNSKLRDSYKIENLMGWLDNKNSPVKAISGDSIHVFISDAIRPEYSEGYTLVSCNLSTDGDLKLTEQVVFFIYDKQIAGIKLISDCF